MRDLVAGMEAEVRRAGIDHPATEPCREPQDTEVAGPPPYLHADLNSLP